jgi:glutamate-1-semialdehyde aminotransferase
LNSKKIPAKIYRYHSMIRLVFTNIKVKNRAQRDFFEERNKLKIENFRFFLETKNILYPKNGLIFLSTQTTKKDINYLIKNFKIALDKFL